MGLSNEKLWLFLEANVEENPFTPSKAVMLDSSNLLNSIKYGFTRIFRFDFAE